MIRSGRHPHEVMFLVYVAIAGLSGLLDPGSIANAVLQALPPLGLAVFFGVFAVGSLLALSGAYAKGLKGPVIEAFGLGITTAQLFGYGIAVFAYADAVYADARGLLSGLFPLCMGIGNLWRMWQVRSEYRAVKAALSAARRAERP